MTWSVSASEMILELRRRFGTRRSTSLTDTVLLPFLNSGIAEVHHLIAEHSPDFLITSSDLATVADTATVALPANFYKGRRVDLVEGASITRLRSYQIDEETYLDEATIWDSGGGAGRPRYMFQAGNIRFVPVPTSIQTVRLWYLPHATRLALEATAELDLATVATNADTIIEAAEGGADGNDITLAFVADGAGAGTLSEGAAPVLVFHYQSGVTTVANFETAVAASTNLAVKTIGTPGNVLTAPGDTFAATNLAGGVDEVTYDGVNGHEDLVYEHALRTAKVRDRMPTQEHDLAIGRLEKRLLSSLASRDQSEPEYLPDLGRGGHY